MGSKIVQIAQHLAELRFGDPPRTKQYKYKPLRHKKQEIRYLTLLPSSGDADIIVKLNVLSLAKCLYEESWIDLRDARALLPDGWEVYLTPEGRKIYEYKDQTTSWNHPNPEYTENRVPEEEGKRSTLPFEALSYAWGNPTTRFDITVREALSSYTLGITQSLHEALLALRSLREQRNLWIDAICINQADLVERASQVRLMSKIYRHAERVVVWLGPPNSDSNTALDALQSLGRHTELDHMGGLISAPGHPYLREAIRAGRLQFDAATTTAMQSLWQRPWFARLWVRQEIHLGTPESFLLCGSASLPWPLFCRAVRAIDILNPGILQSTRSLMGSLCYEVSASRKPLPVLAALSMTSCSDPRDYVYGIMAFMDSNLADRILIDYTLPVSSVFSSLFRACLDTYSRLDLLEMVGLPCREMSQLQFSALSQMQSCAAGLSRAWFRDLDGRHLSLKGLIQSQVVTVHEIAKSKDHYLLGLREIYRHFTDVAGASHEASEQPLKNLILTLCAGLTEETYSMEFDLPSLAQWQSIFAGSVEPSQALKGLLTGIYPQTLLRLNNGGTVLAPSSAQPGEPC